MYLPWSTDLTSFFYQNIADLKSIIGQNILKNERVLVFICTTATKATLYELSYEKGTAVQKALKSYNYPTPSYTTAEGITSIPVSYTHLDMLVWAKKFYGDDFVAYLQKTYNPLDVVFRLANETSLVLLNGGGFAGPKWLSLIHI